MREALLRSLDAPQDVELQGEVHRLLDELADGFAVVELRPEDVVDVANITVPVFSPAGEVVMILTTVGFGAPMAGAVIVAMADRIRASAETISRRAFGAAPSVDGAGGPRYGR
jgi:hypothetical protein